MSSNNQLPSRTFASHDTNTSLTLGDYYAGINNNIKDLNGKTNAQLKYYDSTKKIVCAYFQPGKLVIVIWLLNQHKDIHYIDLLFDENSKQEYKFAMSNKNKVCHLHPAKSGIFGILNQQGKSFSVYDLNKLELKSRSRKANTKSKSKRCAVIIIPKNWGCDYSLNGFNVRRAFKWYYDNKTGNDILSQIQLPSQTIIITIINNNDSESDIKNKPLQQWFKVEMKSILGDCYAKEKEIQLKVLSYFVHDWFFTNDDKYSGDLSLSILLGLRSCCQIEMWKFTDLRLNKKRYVNDNNCYNYNYKAVNDNSNYNHNKFDKVSMVWKYPSDNRMYKWISVNVSNDKQHKYVSLCCCYIDKERYFKHSCRIIDNITGKLIDYQKYDTFKGARISGKWFQVGNDLILNVHYGNQKDGCNIYSKKIESISSLKIAKINNNNINSGNTCTNDIDRDIVVDQTKINLVLQQLYDYSKLNIDHDAKKCILTVADEDIIQQEKENDEMISLAMKQLTDILELYLDGINILSHVILQYCFTQTSRARKVASYKQLCRNDMQFVTTRKSRHLGYHFLIGICEEEIGQNEKEKEKEKDSNHCQVQKLTKKQLRIYRFPVVSM